MIEGAEEKGKKKRERVDRPQIHPSFQKLLSEDKYPVSDCIIAYVYVSKQSYCSIPIRKWKGEKTPKTPS